MITISKEMAASILDQKEENDHRVCMLGRYVNHFTQYLVEPVEKQSIIEAMLSLVPELAHPTIIHDLASVEVPVLDRLREAMEGRERVQSLYIIFADMLAGYDRPSLIINTYAPWLYAMECVLGNSLIGESNALYFMRVDAVLRCLAGQRSAIHNDSIEWTYESVGITVADYMTAMLNWYRQTKTYCATKEPVTRTGTN